MSKKMWQKIFKTKSVQKTSKSTKIKVDKSKRCSIYEEYQQLNGLNDYTISSNFSKQTRENTKKENTNVAMQNFVRNGKDEQENKIQTQKNAAVDFDERPLPAICNQQELSTHQQQQQQTSTFSKVVNTLTLSKRHQRKPNGGDNGNGNINENGNTSTKTKLKTNAKETMKHFSDKENKIASIEDTETAASLSLTPCPICSRRFNTESLRKHIVICEKNAAKKRKPFDSSRQRREGTELAEFAPKMQSTKASPEADEKSTRSLNVDSKRKQAASNNSNGSNNNTAAATVPLSPKPNASNGSAPNANASKNERASTNERPKRAQAMAPPSTQCPHCDRHFGVKAYDRHVEWCKEKSMQTAMKGNTSEKVKAKERLAARTKYRAPIKTKRSLNREKYAGLTADENEEEDSPKAMSSSMISNSKEEDNVSISSQTSYQFSREAFEAEMSLNEEKTKNSVESELKRVLVREAPSNYEQNQDTRRNSYHQEYEENPSEEACMQTNKNVICRGARQFAEPNSGLPFPKNQYFVDDAYPMQRSSSSLYMQQQMEQQMLQQMQHKQQMQMQMQPCYSSLDSFPNPFINFDASPAEMIRKKKKKTHRKSANLGQVLNPNMPMKAFSMPFQDPNMLPMQQNMYEQMMSTFSNTSLCDWALPVDGDAHSYIQDQSNVVPTKTRSKSSLIDSSYDPFLSAKRQLEDLCASGSPPDNNTLSLQYNTKTPSTPTTPSGIIPTKMSTSLTLSASIPTNSSSPSTPKSLQNRKNPTTTATTNTTPTSNFRRTTSLRGPRRSPLLNARPFFAQKRPTIQRGLSDEGPISTNFLKSEEYDEIPVRSVCVNDYAITNSPRVVRRDTSLSNRKANFKLNFSETDRPSNNSATLAQSSDQRIIPTNIPKDLSKTDSLAVFLKYERELEKLNQFEGAQSQESDSKNQSEKAISINESHLSDASKQTRPVITKELKDKSNHLSKQNSSKSSIEDTNANPLKVSSSFEQNKIQNTTIQMSKQEPVLRSSLGSSTKPSQADNFPTRQVRLEPLQHPITSTMVKQPSQLPLLSKHSTTNARSNNAERADSCPGSIKPQQITTTNGATISMSYDKENKALSSSAEFIDPMLINKCDNLPVKLADLKYADSDSSTEQQLCNNNNQAHHVDRATDPYERYGAPISQLSKLLPLVNKTNANSQTTMHMRNAQTQSTPNHIKSMVTNPTLHPMQHQSHTHTTATDNACSISNSSSSRNFLKRKMRLGRNQFLYDASPETLEAESSCSADDETNPRSSAEYDSQLNSTTFEQFVINRQTNPQLPYKGHSPSCMPNLPIFDDFDFEEFLSSFENDDQQFPLFRDCREFLRNRPTNKVPSSTPNRSNSNQIISTSKTPLDLSTNQNQNQNFFQFPVLHHTTQGNPTHILTPSSRRSCTKTSLNRTEMRNDDFHSACSGDSTSLAGDGQAIQNDLQEEQNDEHDRPSISPNSLRNLVGNSQAVVEVEVDAKENKFSKITDADDNNGNINRDENGNNHQLPNVEMNNAKNLIQKMGEDNREICNEDLHDNNNEKANNAKIDGTGDSDEMSSLEGYPFASNSCSRLSAGVASKMSADSAYGSLSRQRSTELMGRSAPRSSSHTRPATAATSNISQLQQQQQFLLQQQYQQQLMLQQQKQQQQQQLKYAQAMLKNSRMRQLSGSSSSSSDNSLPPILVPNPNSFQQQQFLLQQQQQQHQMGQLYQQKPRHRSSPVAATIPMSRFCHECGSKYLVDNAKFCMDCGAKRLMM